MATALGSLKIRIAYLNSPTPKGCYSREKFLDMLYRTEIGAIVAYFCPNLVAMATALAPLKFQIAYLNSPDPKRLLFTRIITRYVVQNWNQCNFGLFCPNLVAMATALAPLKFQIAYIWIRCPQKAVIHAKNFSICCTELKSVQFWLIFAQIWLPWQPPLLPWKFR